MKINKIELCLCLRFILFEVVAQNNLERTLEALKGTLQKKREKNEKWNFELNFHRGLKYFPTNSEIRFHEKNIFNEMLILRESPQMNIEIILNGVCFSFPFVIPPVLSPHIYFENPIRHSSSPSHSTQQIKYIFIFTINAFKLALSSAGPLFHFLRLLIVEGRAAFQNEKNNKSNNHFPANVEQFIF